MTVPASVNYTTGLVTRGNLLNYGMGLLTTTAPLSQTVAGQALTSQSAYGALIALYQGEVASKIVFSVTQAGAGTVPTSFFAGLYTTAGVQLATTAESKSSAALTTLGVQSLTFSSAYTVTSAGVYYLVVWQNGAFGTTALQVARVGNATGSGQAFGSSPSPSVIQTGQAAFPSPATFTANDLGLWLACA